MSWQCVISVHRLFMTKSNAGMSPEVNFSLISFEIGSSSSTRLVSFNACSAESLNSSE